MLENMNLLERKVFQQYWDDGLLDLFAAIGVFLIVGLELYFFRDDLPVEPTVALVAGLPAFLLALLEWTPGMILTVAGAVMLVIAGILLIRFIVLNPAGEEE